MPEIGLVPDRHSVYYIQMLNTHSDARLDSKSMLVILGVLGIIARLFLSAVSIGTNDAVNWYNSALLIHDQGLFAAYAADRFLNNPPLISLLISSLLPVSQKLSMPFFFVLRIPEILADTGSLYLLYRIWSRQGKEAAAASLFGWSLTSILASGYGGHTDALCGFFSLLAAFLFSEKEKPFSSGLALGLAINVKLIPVVLIPAFLFSIRTKRDFALFTSALLICALPFLWMLVFSGSVFYDKVLSYRSIIDYWGIQMFLLLIYGTYPELKNAAGSLISLYHAYGPYLILLITTFYAWSCRRKSSLYGRCAASFALLAIFASGFGLGYFALFLPLIFAFSLKWGSRISLLVGLTLLARNAYFMAQWFPLRSVHQHTLPKLLIFPSFLCWLAMICFFVYVLRAEKPVELSAGSR